MAARSSQMGCVEGNPTVAPFRFPQTHVVLYALEEREELLSGLRSFAYILPAVVRPDAARFDRETLERITILVTSGAVGADADFIASCPNLQCIACWGSGYEQVDLAAARAKGVHVTHSPGANASSVADHAVALLLDCVLRVSRGDRFVRSGAWENAPHSRPRRPPGIASLRVGVLGLGEIGFRAAQRIAAFEAEVSYHNRRRRPDVSWRYFERLIDMADHCDALVVAVRADASNRHLVDSRIIAALGPQGYLVNISRGSVIDEAALVDALADGRLAGAGLDVFAHEPRVPLVLREMPNVVLTPHAGGGTRDAALAMSRMTLENIRAVVEGRTPPNPVPNN